MMKQRKVVITAPIRLDMYKAGLLCREAMKFKAELALKSDGINANAKSMLSILGSRALAGESVTVVAHGGEDEEKAVNTIAALIRNGLREG